MNTGQNIKDRLHGLPSGKYCFYCLHPNPRKIIGPEQILYNCINCGKTDGLIMKIDPMITSLWHNNEIQHFTVGSILKNQITNKFLFIKKRTYPQIIDVVAGHIRGSETPSQALEREVAEETGLTLISYRLLWEGLIKNYYCRYGAPHHYWYLFFGSFNKEPRPDLQEVGYFKEYTWEEILQEKKFNPPVAPIFAKLDPALLES